MELHRIHLHYTSSYSKFTVETRQNVLPENHQTRISKLMICACIPSSKFWQPKSSRQIGLTCGNAPLLSHTWHNTHIVLTTSGKNTSQSQNRHPSIPELQIDRWKAWPCTLLQTGSRVLQFGHQAVQRKTREMVRRTKSPNNPICHSICCAFVRALSWDVNLSARQPTNHLACHAIWGKPESQP